MWPLACIGHRQARRLRRHPLNLHGVTVAPHKSKGLTVEGGGQKDVLPSQKGGFQAAKEGWLKLVASYPKLPGAAYAVAIALASYLNSKTGDAWPSMATLARDTNRNRATVWRSLRELERLKLLDVTHSRSRRKPNRYKPRLGELDAKPETMRRPTTPRGLMLRARNVNAANSQHISCELAARTSEEPQTKCGSVGIQERHHPEALETGSGG